MPSQYSEPTIAELREAFFNEVRGSKDRYADKHTGSILDHFAGAGAIMWSRLARRDTDMWRSILVDLADGQQLTERLSAQHGFDRVADTYGTGTANLARATASSGAGTVWKGTRIRIVGDRITSGAFIVSQDTPVAAGDLFVSVPIRAERTGPGTATESTSARVEDPLWDATWNVTRLSCSDGTAFESPGDARARYRQAKDDGRVGFKASIEDACEAAGATYAVALASNYAGNAYDYGMNVVYVGDSTYNGNDALVRKVKIALESYRVLGDCMQVRPMARTQLSINANVHLWEPPSRVNVAELRRVLGKVAVSYFNGPTRGFSYSRDAIVGAWLRASNVVQYVEFTAPSVDSNVMQTIGGLPNFPATLPRYVLREEDVTITPLPPVA